MKLNLYQRILNYTFRYKGLFILSISGFFLFAAADIFAVEWLKQVIGFINSPTNAFNPFNLATLLMFIAMMRGIGFYIGNFFMSNIGLKVVHDLREDLIKSLLYQPISFFDQASKGEIVNRIIFTTNQITGAATNALKILAKEGFLLIGLFGYLLYLSWKLTLVILIITPFIALIVSVAGKRLRRVAKRIQNAMGIVTQISDEIASGAREIKSYSSENVEEERFKKSNDENLKQNLKMESTSNLATPLIQIFVAFALALMSYLALSNLTELNLPSESFVAFFTAAGLMARPIRQLSSLNAVIQRGLAAAEDIFSSMDQEPENYESGIELKNKITGDVSIENVTFSYDDSKDSVLKNISITANKGETIALVGRSGSGKSTIVNLMNRFYEDYDGSIKIDGYDIRKLKLIDLRKSISYVSQDPTLFNDTVRNNISYGIKEVTDEAIIKAAKEAHALDFINKLPNGLDTYLGDDGILLSGGEKQRIAIARAFLKNSSILIFDEATSALDNESEKEIQTAIQKAAKNKTTFIIAHRLSTVEKADKIFVLENGEITQSGTHEELLKEEGLYNVLQGKPEILKQEKPIVEIIKSPDYVEPQSSNFFTKLGFGNIALIPISFFYWFNSFIKNNFFKPKKSQPDELPVVVVGNLTVGGNGKTPFTSQLALDLKNLGFTPGIIMRGYKGNYSGTKLLNDQSNAKEVGDEALLHYERGFTVVVDRNRSRGLSYINEKTNCDIVISDDGLQHHSMRRDYEIVLEDSENNFGNKLFLPAGPLRDSISRKNNVDMFLWSGRKKGGNFFELEPESWVNLRTSQSYNFDEFPFDKQVNLICGIANPNRFISTAKSIGLIFDERIFGDHHIYRKEDLIFDNKRPLVTTEKDAMRLKDFSSNYEIWYLRMKVKLNVNVAKEIVEKIKNV